MKFSNIVYYLAGCIICYNYIYFFNLVDNKICLYGPNFTCEHFAIIYYSKHHFCVVTCLYREALSRYESIIHSKEISDTTKWKHKWSQNFQSKNRASESKGPDQYVEWYGNL